MNLPPGGHTINERPKDLNVQGLPQIVMLCHVSSPRDPPKDLLPVGSRPATWQSAPVSLAQGSDRQHTGPITKTTASRLSSSIAACQRRDMTADASGASRHVKAGRDLTEVQGPKSIRSRTATGKCVLSRAAPRAAPRVSKANVQLTSTCLCKIHICCCN